METLFGLLGQILEAMLSIVPRLSIVRATHEGIKWKYGKTPVAIKPGLMVHWPLVTDVEFLVVARQTFNIPNQVLMTADEKQVVVGAFVVYKINNIVQAIGERNWDVESTVGDITQAAIVEEITSRNLDELLAGISGGRESELNHAITNNCRSQLNQFGVYIHRCGLTDFSTCRVHKILGGDITRIAGDE